MKDVLKVAGMMILLGFVFFFGTKLLCTQERQANKPPQLSKSQDTTTQEIYISTVIISAPWGKTNLVYGGKESPPGEFGFHVSEEGEGGPGTFAVAPNGDIYIADPLNKRMQRFNSEGGFISTIPMPKGIVDICIDQNNNIYLLSWGLKPEQLGDKPGTIGSVLKCDQTGNILMTYHVFTGVAMTANFIYCDKFDRIFFAYPWNGDKSGFYQVGTSERAFSLTEQKNSARIGWLGYNSATLDTNCFIQAAILPQWRFRALFLISFLGDTLKSYRPYPHLEGEVFGCDEQFNIYLTHSDNNTFLIKKYDAHGTLVSTFEYWCPKPYSHVYDFGGSRTMIVDKKGNLYMLCYSQDDGLRVIKWYKE